MACCSVPHSTSCVRRQFVLRSQRLLNAAMVEAARAVELLAACEAARSRAEVQAHSTAAAMRDAASRTECESLCSWCHAK